MRVLVASTANEGHFGPLVGLADALRAAGHEVRVAAPMSYAARVERTGLPFVPFDDPDPGLIGPVMARLPTLSPEEADTTVVREVFARIDAQAALPTLRAAVVSWRPDVVVREPAEFGSLAAAVAAGVPSAQVSIGMTEMTRLLLDLVADPLTELAALVGRPSAALADAAERERVLTTVPASLDRAGDPAPVVRTVAVRYRESAVASPEPLPDWGDPAAPLVYATFGSVTGSLPPFAGVFRQALDGLADLPARVLLTVGPRVDLASLGPVPPNARVEAWRPQTDVLPYADVVLSHGGFGTVMGAVAAGVPQVVAPIFTSDQRVNARHVDASGAGRGVAPGLDVVARACAEVADVLADRSCRERAAALARDVAALPQIEAAVAALEEHVRA